MPLAERLGDHLDQVRLRRIALGVFGSLALLTLRVRSPLSWDEAVYAARAKDLVRRNFDLDGITGAYWSDLRAPGFPHIMAFAFEIFGESDLVARSVTIALSVGLLAMIAKCLDLVSERRVGTTAIILAALCPGFFATSTLAFADHGAAFFAVTALYFALRAYRHESPRYLAFVPALLAISTSIRFGSVMFVAAPLAIVGVLVLYDAMRDHDWQLAIPFVITGAVSSLTVLYLLTSTALTTVTSPLSTKNTFVDQAGRSSGNWIHDLRTILHPGPVDYGFNGAFWGWSYLLFFVFLVVVVTMRMLVNRKLAPLAMMGFIALTPVLLYGLAIRQFVTTYLAPEFAIGVSMVAWALWLPGRDREHPPLRKMPAFAPPLGLGLIAAITIFVGWRTVTGVEAMHERLWGFEQVRAASIIADDILGPNCQLFTARVPQASWYSECTTSGFSSAFQPDGAPVGGHLPWDKYINASASQLDPPGSSALGFLLLEGAGGQPETAEVWGLRILESSVVLHAPNGRRVLLFGVDAP